MQNVPLPARLMRRLLVITSVTLAAATGVAFAQSWPTKPVKLIHAFAAGSVTDNTGRLIADGLSQRLGQPVVVENKPGANMIIGTEFSARQPADGHTMLIVTVDNFAINPNLYKNPGYRTADFDPVTLIGPLPMVLFVPPNSPYNTLADMKAAYERTKKPLIFGTWGVGSLAHMVGEMIKAETGIGLEFVPFQGAVPATTAVLGGHVEASINGSGAVADLVKSGKAKAIAIGGSARVPELAQVPTFQELGFPNVRSQQWHGVAMRAGGNREIIEKMHKEIAAVLSEPRAREQLAKAGYSRVDARPPAEFAKFVESEAALWGRIVKASGATAER